MCMYLHVFHASLSCVHMSALSVCVLFRISLCNHSLSAVRVTNTYGPPTAHNSSSLPPSLSFLPFSSLMQSSLVLKHLVQNSWKTSTLNCVNEGGLSPAELLHQGASVRFSTVEGALLLGETLLN